MDLEDASQLGQRYVWLDHPDATGLGAVHRRTPSKGDERLAVSQDVGLIGPLDAGDGGVGDNPVEDGHGDIPLLERPFQRKGQAGRTDIGVCHQEDALDALPVAGYGYFIGRMEDLRVSVGENGEDGPHAHLNDTTRNTSTNEHG